MKNIKLILLFISLFQSIAFSQDWDNHVFAHQVKQIDEFLGRFNGDTSTLIYEYRMRNFPDLPMDRIQLLLTLFDQRKPDWDTTLIRAFVDDVVNGGNTTTLSFYDEDWYAKLFCSMRYKGNPEKVILTLQVEHDESYASKWVIRGVDADFLELSIDDQDGLILNPSSEGTDFINLRKLFSADKNTIRGYLYRNFRAGKMALFIQELLDGHIDYDQIDKITYHFLQINGWSFTVSKFLRDDPNSGWLISSLKPMNEKEKLDYRTNALNLD